MRTLLLPGMDGTGKLFTDFISHLPAVLAPEIVPYPDDVPAVPYLDLLERLPSSTGRVCLVAESFSGPLAIFAASCRSEVAALVLVASFAKFPAGRAIRALAAMFPAQLLGQSVPRFAIRHFLAGHDAPASLVDQVRDVIGRCRAGGFGTSAQADMRCGCRSASPRTYDSDPVHRGQT